MYLPYWEISLCNLASKVQIGWVNKSIAGTFNLVELCLYCKVYLGVQSDRIDKNDHPRLQRPQNFLVEVTEVGRQHL